MLHLVQSNRLDALADAMLERWPAPAAGRPQAPTIIVHSAAVQRWLEQRIASRRGICAGVEFQFAARFVWETFSRALPGVPPESPFDRDAVTLRLFELLARLPGEPAYAPLHHYLASGEERRRLELAQRIAQVYSQYMLYRPEWLAAWDGNGSVPALEATTQAWQAALWRQLRQSLAAATLGHPREQFFRRLAAGGDAGGVLPPRLAIFALPAVPPMYGEILVGLSAYTQVDWYFLNPCAEFWSDIRTEKSQARSLVRGDPAAGHGEVRNALLPSWGAQARTQLGVLMDALGGEGAEPHDRFRGAFAPTALGWLQHSILSLQDQVPPPPADASLQVHACHSLMRQLEVLQDRLLALFAAHPDLRAGDVAVFLPDLDEAAPLIDAVFGAAPEPRRIPYAISGRSRPDDAPFLQALDLLLQLPESRFEAAALLGWLELPAVAARFELDPGELAAIGQWLRAAGARWGLDAQHRAAFGLPAEPRHSWSAALHRLLVGYALPAGSDAPLAGLVPHGELEGAQAHTLGKLAAIISALAQAADALRPARPLAQWAGDLRALTDRFLRADADALPDLRRVHDALAAIATDAAGLGQAVGLDTMRALLQARLVEQATAQGPGGRLLFSRFGPLRGVPFRVVAVLGLEHDAFPRNPPRIEFDLSADAPRPGDRRPREEDRGGFLDAVCAARQALILGYTGRSIHDNTPLPPSVVVAELLDFLARARGAPLEDIRREFVVDHPLQPFDARYFAAPGRESGAAVPASFDADQLAAAQALQQPLARRGLPRGIADTPLPATAGDGAELPITLDALAWFFRSPASAYLRRLGVNLREAEAEIEADEPFELDRAWDLQEAILDQRLAGWPASRSLEFALARDEVPHGAWGEGAVRETLAQVEALVRSLGDRGAERDPHAFDLELDGARLCGTLAGLRPEGLLGLALGKGGAHNLLPWWLRHLVLCAEQPAGVQLETRVILPDSEWIFDPVANARACLSDLVAAYREGQREPLPFHPRTAWALALSESEYKALQAWEGSRDHPGECRKPAYLLIHGGALDAPPGDWVACGGRILGPLMDARRKKP